MIGSIVEKRDLWQLAGKELSTNTKMAEFLCAQQHSNSLNTRQSFMKTLWTKLPSNKLNEERTEFSRIGK